MDELARGAAYLASWLERVVVSRASLRDPTQVDESRAATARYRSLARQYAHVRTPYWKLQDFAVERCRWLADLPCARALVGIVYMLLLAAALPGR